MDYSKAIQASDAADLAYAQWYAQLPDERKAAFFRDGFQFVADKIRYDVLQENPFATEAEIVLRFIELTQPSDYLPEVFAHMRQHMQDCIEAEWKQRFRHMKRTLGWSYDQMAAFIGAANGASLKASVSRQLPAFAKLAVCVFEQMEQKSTKPIGNSHFDI
jgi:hypothetical protein